ncbi:type IV toxin-antitoxin system AbiEi family antitoxin [Microbacterium sp.]|jgi:hypothetical protein|uniref:type IV toxin-antitoxin system AbiEi family antitoxin n=1 Tax=Microbacterium sp. TaxID=51671 RepID=UPI0037C75D27
MRWPLIYLPGERLSIAELSAARLDGDVVEIGEGYMPADAIESTATRAASLRSICGPRLVVGSWSAAWVYGALPEPPSRHSVLRGAAHRVGNLIDRRAIFHDVGVDDQDVSDVEGVLVTSPLRTLIDVARRIREPEHRERATSVVDTLIDAGLVDPRDAISRIDSVTRLPGSKQARRELARHLEEPSSRSLAARSSQSF